MRKLKAFTLTELLVGMIISAIVIAFGYEAYAMIYKQYLSFKGVKKELVNTVQLNSTMNTDFINATVVHFHDNKLMLDYEARKSIQYEFEDSLVLRTDGEVTDTFKLAAFNIVAQPAIYNSEEQATIINGIFYDAKILGETEHFSLTKDYSAETLMDLQISN